MKRGKNYNEETNSYISDRKMLMQCLKCTLFYRSLSKLKSHKSVGPCADKLKLKNKTENFEEYSKVEDLAKSIQGAKIDDDNTLEENLGDNLIGQIKTEPNDMIEEIKTEPTEVHPANIKLEPKEEFEVAKPATLMRYDDAEEYVPAPIVVIDSDDEYEPESDDSAPDDDDVEAVGPFIHLKRDYFYILTPRSLVWPAKD